MAEAAGVVELGNGPVLHNDAVLRGDLLMETRVEHTTGFPTPARILFKARSDSQLPFTTEYKSALTEFGHDQAGELGLEEQCLLLLTCHHF